MTRRLLVLLAVIAGLVLPTTTATADDHCREATIVDGQGNITVVLECDDEGGGGGGGGSVPGGGVDPVDDGGITIRWTAIDFSVLPPCTYAASERLYGYTPEQAEVIERSRQGETNFRIDERLLNLGEETLPCEGEDGPPEPQPEDVPPLAVLDAIRDRLPRPDPVVAGGRAITGNRSWLDLRRPDGYSLDETLDLGPFGTFPVSVAGEVEAVVDWDDGTVRTYPGAGGPYRSGEPGPDDITHTYVDTGARTVTVTDRWTLRIEVAGFDIGTITEDLAAVPLDVQVNEVRSNRDR